MYEYSASELKEGAMCLSACRLATEDFCQLPIAATENHALLFLTSSPFKRGRSKAF